jgi:hypothetical protein
MKKRAPGWKKKEERKIKPATYGESLVTVTSGDEAMSSWQALMERVRTGESELVFLDDDLPDDFLKRSE